MTDILNRIKTLAFVAGLTIIAALPLVLSAQAFAQLPPDATGAACQGIGAAGQQGCDGSAGVSVSQLITTVINIISWIVGVVAVIMIIIGGFKLMTAGGDANGVASARRTVIYALVGVAVAAMAQFLIKFVFDSVDNS